MDKVFIVILNMSITCSFVIAFICFARLFLKRAPKIISYFLWAAAGFRLVFPFSIESVFNLIPFHAQVIPADIAMQSAPRINSGIPAINSIVSDALPASAPYASTNPLQVWITVGACAWIIGAVLIVTYGIISFIVLKHKMQSSVCAEANIYETKNIKTPFVLGLFSPKIYMPFDLSEQERNYILRHEQTHIRRCDHIIKFTAYFILAFHWFNPLVWLAFRLMSADMEMSCDEHALSQMQWT